jgi:hypothetical protein
LIGAKLADYRVTTAPRLPPNHHGFVVDSLSWISKNLPQPRHISFLENEVNLPPTDYFEAEVICRSGQSLAYQTKTIPIFTVTLQCSISGRHQRLRVAACRATEFGIECLLFHHLTIRLFQLAFQYRWWHQKSMAITTVDKKLIASTTAIGRMAICPLLKFFGLKKVA